MGFSGVNSLDANLFFSLLSEVLVVKLFEHSQPFDFCLVEHAKRRRDIVVSVLPQSMVHYYHALGLGQFYE